MVEGAGHEGSFRRWATKQSRAFHPVPAGEGLIERGVPGRASWVETSREGLTGPWVKGQAGAATPRGRGLSIPPGAGAGCERAMGCCGQGQAVRMPPVAVL